MKKAAAVLAVSGAALFGLGLATGLPLKLLTVHIVDKGKPLYDYGQ